MQPTPAQSPLATAEARPRTLIVEDHQLLAETLMLALGARGLDGRVASVCEREAIMAEVESSKPDLVLLDLDLGELDGLQLIGPIHASGTRVLVVSASRDQTRLAAAVALGAVGWIAKSAPFEDLVSAAESAARGEPLASTNTMQALHAIGQKRLDDDREVAVHAGKLTRRERAVLVALSEGMTATDIAEQLIVSVGTVRSHIRAIFRKLGVSSQITAVAIGRRLLAPADAELLAAERAAAVGSLAVAGAAATPS